MLNKCLLLSIISHTPFIFFYMWTLYKLFLTHLGWPSFSLLILGLSLYMLLDPPWPYAIGPSLDDIFLQMPSLTPKPALRGCS